MNIKDTLTDTLIYGLQKYPLIGASAGATAGAIHWELLIRITDQILSTIGIAAGAGVAIVTLWLKIRELKDRKRVERSKTKNK